LRKDLYTAISYIGVVIIPYFEQCQAKPGSQKRKRDQRMQVRHRKAYCKIQREYLFVGTFAIQIIAQADKVGWSSDV
jgi:hypothetical protein